MLARIVAPHFVAGVVLGERAAPIVRYMVRWPMTRITGWCRSRGWRVEFLP